MTKKKHKNIQDDQASVIDAGVQVIDAGVQVIDAPVEKSGLSQSDLDVISKQIMSENELDGLAIVVIKDGSFVPYALAKSVGDLLTMKFMLEREVGKIIDSLIIRQKNKE